VAETQEERRGCEYRLWIGPESYIRIDGVEVACDMSIRGDKGVCHQLNCARRKGLNGCGKQAVNAQRLGLAERRQPASHGETEMVSRIGRVPGYDESRAILCTGLL